VGNSVKQEILVISYTISWKNNTVSLLWGYFRT